jgi:hypothetical protein
MVSRGQLIQVDDHQYYNISIRNDSTAYINATYSQTSTTAILDNPSDTHLTFVRWKVPAGGIPLFTFVDDYYYVTLTYSSTDFTEPVVFISGNLSDTTDKGVYSIFDFLKMINIALSDAFDALKIAFPAAPPSTAPFIIFNPDSQLFSFIGIDDYSAVIASAPTIEVWLNTVLYQRFGTFQAFFNGFTQTYKNYNIEFYDRGNNLGTFTDPTMASYLDMKQELEAIGLMQDITAIVFTTTSIPIKAEYVQLAGSNNSSSTNTRKIITDFEPEISGNSPSPSASLFYQYFPTGPYRLVDLLSNTPLYTIDIQIYWQDKNGDLFPIKIPPNQSATMKILFQKKNRYDEFGSKPQK